MGKQPPPDRAPQDVPDADSQPPQIPPRMKKKGPALPEKPPHMRASSQPPLREPLRALGNQREVLVAACRGGTRERPAERRQREPAKLLKPTGSSAKDTPAKSNKELLPVLPSRGGPLRLSEDCLPPRRDFATPWSHHDDFRLSTAHNRKGQPVLLIPRNLLVSAWGSCALWTQHSPGIRSLKHNPLRPPSDTSSPRARSGSVTRSGSLTSQGSSGSDSGGETFPKSVLKKQRRTAGHSASTCKGPSASRKVDSHKKNVTFNAFATVQLMEE